MFSLTTILSVAYLAILIPGTNASAAETNTGFSIVWQDDFSGSGPVDTSKWQYYTGAQTNNEEETYTSNNCQLSGSGSLLLVPKNSNGQWTSCRIETVSSFQAKSGGQMIVQSRFRVASGGDMQGIWPAFWSLGEAMREGTPWPQCGEIDTFENVDGAGLGYGTLHCGSCPEPSGLSQGMGFGRGGFHTWAHAIDLRESDWTQQSITWYMDGQPYHVIHGSDLGNEGSWQAVAQSPMYMTLNVAIGGGWAGAAASGTETGAGAEMEVLYVAVYQSD